MFTGSVVIFESETIQEVEKFIETDMFYRGEIVCLSLDAHHFNNVLNAFRNCLISGIRRRLFFCHSGSIRSQRSSDYFGFSDVQDCLELTCISEISHITSAHLSEPL